jgi:hypothetical protein
MSLRLTKLSRQKRLNEIPGDSWSDGSAAHAENIHMIVLDTLLC